MDSSTIYHLDAYKLDPCVGTGMEAILKIENLEISNTRG